MSLYSHHDVEVPEDNIQLEVDVSLLSGLPEGFSQAKFDNMVSDAVDYLLERIWDSQEETTQ